jgi:hypothetical protein
MLRSISFVPVWTKVARDDHWEGVVPSPTAAGSQASWRAPEVALDGGETLRHWRKQIRPSRFSPARRNLPVLPGRHIVLHH